MKEDRTTKYVTMTITATFHGDYLDVDEVGCFLQTWIDSGLDDREDLRSWDYGTAAVAEVAGDPEGFDSDEPPNGCMDAAGGSYAQHDYADYGLDAKVCKRCGA